MKRITYLATLLFSLTMCSQITYNSTDFAAVNENYIVSSTSIGIADLDFVATGTNFNWNYSALEPANQETITYVNPTTTNYKNTWCFQNFYFTNCNSQFNNSFNLAKKLGDGLSIQGYGVTNVFEHSKKDATSLKNKMLGATFTIGGISVPYTINYTVPDLVYSFPIGYNDNYTNSGSYSIDLNPLGVDLLYTNTFDRTNLVEGWGALTTPFGVFQNVLKMKTTLVENTSIVTQGQTTPTTVTTVSYKWFDTAYGIPVLEVSGLLLGSVWTPTNASYIDNQQCLQPLALFGYLPVVADFDPIAQEAIVSFVNASNNADAYLWDFGDGATATTENPTHTYTCPGNKNVTLTITNSLCNPSTTDEIVIPVIISDTQNAFTTNVTVNEATLTADRILAGTNYQWLDCNNNNAPIANATAVSFTAVQNGNYAVQLTTNGCVSVSDCYAVQLLSDDSFFTNSSLELYPNPTTGILKFADNATVIKEVKIYNALGMLVSEKLDLTGLANGIYFIKANTSKGLLMRKVMKN